MTSLQRPVTRNVYVMCSSKICHRPLLLKRRGKGKEAEKSNKEKDKNKEKGKRGETGSCRD